MSDAGFKNKKAICLIALLTIAAIAAVFFLRQETPTASQAKLSKQVEKTVLPELLQPAKQFKVLCVMSYHSPWKWTDDQLQGFKESLNGLNVQYKVFQMDTKRQSSEQWKTKVAAQAKELIETWKPDLVFTGDDNAQQYVTKDYVNTDIPFVFCAVIANPKDCTDRATVKATGTRCSQNSYHHGHGQNVGPYDRKAQAKRKRTAAGRRNCRLSCARNL